MNYGQLKTAVSAYANRADLTAMFGTFLELAEHRLYAGSFDGMSANLQTQPLRLSSMIATVNPASTVLPADFLELKRLSAIVGNNKIPLDFIPYETAGISESTSGKPNYFSLIGNNIVYSPTFTNAVEMVYYARFVTPVADTDTNWMLTNAAAVYLAAMLIEVAVYTKNNPMFEQQLIRFSSAMISLQAQDDGNKHSGAQLRVRTDGRRLI